MPATIRRTHHTGEPLHCAVPRHAKFFLPPFESDVNIVSRCRNDVRVVPTKDLGLFCNPRIGWVWTHVKRGGSRKWGPERWGRPEPVGMVVGRVVVRWCGGGGFCRCFFWRSNTTRWTCLLRLYTHVNAGQDKGGSQEQASRRLYFFTQQRTDNGRDHKSQRVA